MRVNSTASTFISGYEIREFPPATIMLHGIGGVGTPEAKILLLPSCFLWLTIC